MTRAPKQCRRGHAMTGKNVRKQTNNDTRVDGAKVRYVTRVCVACIAYRYKRKAKGLKIKDLRRGRR